MTRNFLCLALALVLSLPAGAARRPWRGQGAADNDQIKGCIIAFVLAAAATFMLAVANRPQPGPMGPVSSPPPPKAPVDAIAGPTAGEIGLQALQAVLDGDHVAFLAHVALGSPAADAYSDRARFDELTGRLRQMQITFPFGTSEFSDEMRLMAKTGQSPNDWIGLATMRFSVRNGRWRLHSIQWD